MRQETDYVTHHIQKILAFFNAMRQFAAQLKEDGHQVRYYQLDDEDNHQELEKNLLDLIEQHQAEKFEYQWPDEYRLDQQLCAFCKSLDIKHSATDTEHFITERNEVATFFKGKKQFLMETFYRHIRKKHGWLMDGDEPEGGQWNFDHDNRKSLPKEHQPVHHILFEHDVTDLYQLIQASDIKTMGQVKADSFIWPANRQEALQVLWHFLRHLLPYFGRYEDAMHSHDPYVYHSRLSFALNVKMLSPREVVEKAITYWEQNRDDISINQIEGFVRQIVGWREYMRGIYWNEMPGYASKNYFEHKQPLPHYFWSGDTNMNCLKHTLQQSLNQAYAHHIQRLMVAGNFALLAGCHPDEVDQWYLGVYIDAIEWVEMPNTRGMSQYADGGLLATKPYVSSANYIHKMSNYCTGCHYNYKEKTGDKSCPFNSLYWHFFHRHQDKLESNGRVSVMYRVWDKNSDADKKAILNRAKYCLKNLDKL